MGKMTPATSTNNTTLTSALSFEKGISAGTFSSPLGAIIIKHRT
jgi:hypothetical protein